MYFDGASETAESNLSATDKGAPANSSIIELFIKFISNFILSILKFATIVKRSGEPEYFNAYSCC